MKRSEVKYGALLSYVLIFANTFYGLVVSPYLLGTLGKSEYGVYKTIAGMTAMVSVLEMGIGSTMQRFIAKMNAEGRRNESENFSAMGLIQVFVLVPAMGIVGLVLYPGLESAFTAFTPQEIVRAKELFALMVLHVVLHMFENFYFGIIAGYNRFVFNNSLKLGMLVLRIVLYYVCLPLFPNSITIVAITLGLEILVILVEIFFIRYGLGHRIRLRKWNNRLFRDSFFYTILLFIQSIVIQFNGNVDSVLIGSIMGTAAVSLYSFALQIFNMYETCATSISGVLLPTVTKKMVGGADSNELEKMVIKYGRAQWMFLGGVLFALLVCGKEFFRLWLGKRLGITAEHCWLLCLILTVPVTFPLITNTCLTILKARNALGFRTICLGCSAVVNVILTYFGTKIWGYWAAAAGTAVSTLCGSVIVMSIYYQKKLGLRMLIIAKEIFHGITPCLLLAAIPCAVLNFFLWGSWISFVVKVILFVLVYGVCLIGFGLNRSERSAILFLKG
ncbi:MAG: oligosaccharide flippase family protein [Oscillospiraceae bacterium]|nr:oligosaccharide flippase family protein [Oscillospiraceae bacterium]